MTILAAALLFVAGFLCGAACVVIALALVFGGENL